MSSSDAPSSSVLQRIMRRVSSLAMRILPGPVVHRLAAWSFRWCGEQRMLFLDELVDPQRGAVDVGAWWGPWTYWLAKRCPQVWSFEPNPQLAKVLTRAARPNVHVEPVALSDHTGSTTLFVPRQLGDEAQATLEAGHRLATAEEVTVDVRRLDDYDLGDIGFMKIDVEAHEAAMLRGALGVLRRCRPVVLIEIEQRFHEQPIDAIFSYFLDLGYSGWIRRAGQWEPLSTFSVERDQVPFQGTPKDTRYINNFVFTPTANMPGR